MPKVILQILPAVSFLNILRHYMITNNVNTTYEKCIIHHFQMVSNIFEIGKIDKN